MLYKSISCSFDFRDFCIRDVANQGFLNGLIKALHFRLLAITLRPFV